MLASEQYAYTVLAALLLILAAVAFWQYHKERRR